MSTVKISQLSAVTSLNSADVLPVVDSGANPGSPTTYKITVQNLANSLTQVSSSISASYASNGGVTSIIAGTGISVNASTGNITITNTGGGGASFPYTGSAIISGSLLVTGSVRASEGGFTGSLFGTSSWASNALTSSFITLAQTASFVNLAQTASFVTLAQTASFVTLAQTASFVALAQSASFVISAQTASFVRNLSQDLVITGSVIISGSPSPEIRIIGEMTVTGSVIISGSAPLRLFGSASIVSGSLAVGNINPSSTVGRIDASNDIVAYSTSDARLKTEVSPIQDPISKVNMISGVNFTWIENPDIHGNSGKDVGVIAQEIEKVLPEVVTTRDNGYKAVKYEKIVPLLIEAIKDLQKQIDELKAGK